MGPLRAGTVRTLFIITFSVLILGRTVCICRRRTKSNLNGPTHFVFSLYFFLSGSLPLAPIPLSQRVSDLISYTL